MSISPPKLVTTKVKAYVGTWNDGELGWGMPQFLARGMRSPEPPNRDRQDGTWFYLCEVTIKPILRKGKPTRRRKFR